MQRTNTTRIYSLNKHIFHSPCANIPQAETRLYSFHFKVYIFLTNQALISQHICKWRKNSIQMARVRTTDFLREVQLVCAVRDEHYA
jgi:hypothetical protein